MSEVSTDEGQLLEALAASYAAGRLAHAELALPRKAFDDHARAAASRRRARRAGDDAPSLSDVVASAVASDLYLATAAIHGVEGAWERLEGGLRPRLLALARARGAGTVEAERLVTDLLGDLALPGGGAPRLLATYDATGSLFGWLATTLVRRWWRNARATRKGPRALEDRASMLPPATAPGPAATAATREWGGHVRTALLRALERLTPREHAVLVMRHVDGRTGRDIARILGVGPPRVSRLLQQATGKVREGLLPLVRSAGVRGRLDEESWEALRDGVGEALQMAIPREDAPLPHEGARGKEGTSDA